MPESEPLAALLAGLHTPAPEPLPTFPAGSPNRQIDYILFRPAALLVAGPVRVLDEPVASDHRPNLAVFTVN